MHLAECDENGYENELRNENECKNGNRKKKEKVVKSLIGFTVLPCRSKELSIDLGNCSEKKY